MTNNQTSLSNIEKLKVTITYKVCAYFFSFHILLFRKNSPKYAIKLMYE